jgi:tetratricopeptide (TPR) repeat protein
MTKQRVFTVAQGEASTPVSGEHSPGTPPDHLPPPPPGQVPSLDLRDKGQHRAMATPLPTVPGYEILRELGRGGMGVVYQARQTKLDRLVALKMILAGEYAGSEQVSRFRSEAEAVARLQHPNIVQIHEVGEHEGQPYFALEYVEGGSLAQRLAGMLPPAREAAQLVETVARAVDYAHQRGIIHRDLKPANVLLTPDGLPKITDFGLAKRLDISPGQTQSGEILGTPSYMAPEQTLGQSQVVGPAADTYALGAILYEAMTGRPPFKGETALETLEQVRSLEPVPPRRLQPKLPPDLETICLKALAKAPGQRYASARDLADDLRRFLNGEPIRARPVGLAERLWRRCRRNPVVAGLLAASLMLLIGGFAGVTWQWRQAREHLILANQQRDRAEANFLLARDAVDQMLTEVGQEHLKDIPEMDPVRKVLLEKALVFYRKFLHDQGDSAPVRHEVGQAYRRVGEINQMLGYHAEAEAAYRRALEVQSQLVEESSGDPEHRRQLAKSHFHLGNLYQTTDRVAEAEAAHKEAWNLVKQLAQEYPDTPDYQQDLAASYNALGSLYGKTGRQIERRTAYSQALNLLDQLVRAYPLVRGYQEDLATSYNRLGGVWINEHRPNEAKSAILQALDIWEKLTHAHPANTDYQDKLASSHYQLGMLYSTSQPGILFPISQREEAVAAFKEAIAIREKLAREHPAVPRYREYLASNDDLLGHLYITLNQTDQAEAAYNQARENREKLVHDYPSIPRYQSDLAASLLQLANVYREMKRPDQAEANYLKALDLQEKLVRAHPSVTEYPEALAISCFSLGLLYDRINRPSEAETAFRRAVDINEKLAREHPAQRKFAIALGTSCTSMGNSLCRHRKYEAGFDWFARAVRQLEPWFQPDAKSTSDRKFLRDAYKGRAAALNDLSRYTEALKDWDRAIELASDTDRDLRLFRALTLAHLGEHSQATTEAEALIRKTPTASFSYYAACVFARSSPAARQDAKLPPADRDKRAEHYAARAMECLVKARAAGYFKTANARERLQKEKALDPLRARPDFKQLLAELEANKTPAAK